MKISKRDALSWFEFLLSQLPEGEEIMPHQYEIIYATYAQIEAAIDKRDSELMAQIPGLKSLSGRTYYVGDDAHFARG